MSELDSERKRGREGERKIERKKEWERDRDKNRGNGNGRKREMGRERWVCWSEIMMTRECLKYFLGLCEKGGQKE